MDISGIKLPALMSVFVLWKPKLQKSVDLDQTASGGWSSLIRVK